MLGSLICRLWSILLFTMDLLTSFRLCVSNSLQLILDIVNGLICWYISLYIHSENSPVMPWCYLCISVVTLQHIYIHAWDQVLSWIFADWNGKFCEKFSWVQHDVAESYKVIYTTDTDKYYSSHWAKVFFFVVSNL